MKPLETQDPARFDTPTLLKKLAASSRRLAELKRLAGSIPNLAILISTFGLQETQDRSEIENMVRLQYRCALEGSEFMPWLMRRVW